MVALPPHLQSAYGSLLQIATSPTATTADLKALIGAIVALLEDAIVEPLLPPTAAARQQEGDSVGSKKTRKRKAARKRSRARARAAAEARSE